METSLAPDFDRLVAALEGLVQDHLLYFRVQTGRPASTPRTAPGAHGTEGPAPRGARSAPTARTPSRWSRRSRRASTPPGPDRPRGAPRGPSRPADEGCTGTGGTDPAYVADAASHANEVGLGVNVYWNGHAFKLQNSVVAFVGADGAIGELNARVILDATF